MNTLLKVKLGRLLLALVLCSAVPESLLAQTAPAPRAVVPADSAPEALSGIFTALPAGSDQVVEIEGAQWLQLQFGAYSLGATGKLTITGPTGDVQTFDQEQLAAWEGLTGIFNGSRLTVALAPGTGETASASIGKVIIGLPVTTGTDSAEAAAPQALQSLFGSSLGQFIPPQPERKPFPNPAEEGTTDAGIESICGTNDNRTSSSHKYSGRIMPIGCTGWIIEGGSILTAGHCIGSGTQTLEFNVPSSKSNGTTVSPSIQHQYKVKSDSIVDGYTGVGNDWATFKVLPNTQSGKTPIQVQGGGFKISKTANPTSVTITGYGVDGPGPTAANPQWNFGKNGPRNADNQTLQTHSGTLTSHVDNGTENAVIRYSVDTQGGNSGSPVYGPGNVAIGIHTNGGCGKGGGSNAGTSFRNDALWSAIPKAVAGGWHVCDIVRTGAGWGNHYAALTCPSGPFTNKWHRMKANQKDAMLETALTAATSGEKVQVYIASGSPYDEIRALYIRK